MLAQPHWPGSGGTGADALASYDTSVVRIVLGFLAGRCYLAGAMQKDSKLRPVHIFLTYTIDAPDVSSCEGSRNAPVGHTYQISYEARNWPQAMKIVEFALSGAQDFLSEFVSHVSLSSRTRAARFDRERPDLAAHAAELASCRAFMALDEEGQAAHFAAQRAAYEALQAELAVAA